MMNRPARISRSVPASSSEKEPPSPVTVRVPGALQMTGLSRAKLYALIAEGEIEIVKVGAVTLIVVDSIRAFVERKRHRAPGS